MCYEFDEYLRQRAEEARRAAEQERSRKEKAPAKPADKPKGQPEPVPV